MKIDFYKCFEFLTVLIVSITIGIKYDSTIGLVVFVSLTTLIEIKDAVQEGAKK